MPRHMPPSRRVTHAYSEDTRSAECGSRRNEPAYSDNPYTATCRKCAAIVNPEGADGDAFDRIMGACQ